MKQYNFMRLSEIEGESFDDIINKALSEGWELVSISDVITLKFGHEVSMAWFKREKK